MILQMLTKFKAELKLAGQKVTAPRLAVFEFLRANDPTTVAKLIAGTKHQANRASIYRSLTLMRRSGVIKDVVIAGRRMIELTDRFDNHHHHLTCTVCGRSESVESPAIERALNKLATLKGYQPRAHQIEISGLCANCRD